MFTRCFRLNHTLTQYPVVIFASLVPIILLFLLFWWASSVNGIGSINDQCQWKMDQTRALCCEISRYYQHSNYAYYYYQYHYKNTNRRFRIFTVSINLQYVSWWQTVHIKTSSAIPFTTKMSPNQISTTCTWKCLKALLGQSLSTIQVRFYIKRRANE